jgi:hypothetical protein
LLSVFNSNRAESLSAVTGGLSQAEITEASETAARLANKRLDRLMLGRLQLAENKAAISTRGSG